MVQWSILVFLTLVGAVFLFRFIKGRRSNIGKRIDIPNKWIPILQNNVAFYATLPPAQKKVFEHDVVNFLQHVSITGVGVNVTLEDRLLVASSAVIPLFGFPAYTYSYLDEVLLYPGAFDSNFELGNPDEVITGMVGSGVMEGKMILAKPALHMGFKNTIDKSKLGIHEFAHLFDKEDGVVDGMPPGFDDKKITVPWIDLVRRKISEMKSGDSDINDYGATNTEEFFAVASEYFFENPEMMRKRHPELYGSLTSIFNQKLVTNRTRPDSIGRNDDCLCGSDKKYKRCCL